MPEINEGRYAMEEYRPSDIITPGGSEWLFPEYCSDGAPDTIITSESGHDLPCIGDATDALEDLIVDCHPRSLRIRNVDTGFVVVQYTPDTGERVYPP